MKCVNQIFPAETKPETQSRPGLSTMLGRAWREFQWNIDGRSFLLGMGVPLDCYKWIPHYLFYMETKKKIDSRWKWFLRRGRSMHQINDAGIEEKCKDTWRINNPSLCLAGIFQNWNKRLEWIKSNQIRRQDRDWDSTKIEHESWRRIP